MWGKSLPSELVLSFLDIQAVNKGLHWISLWTCSLTRCRKQGQSRECQVNYYGAERLKGGKLTISSGFENGVFPMNLKWPPKFSNRYRWPVVCTHKSQTLPTSQPEAEQQLQSRGGGSFKAVKFSKWCLFLSNRRNFECCNNIIANVSQDLASDHYLLSRYHFP